MPCQAFHAMPSSEAATILDTDPLRGLDPDEAVRRLSEVGPNELPPPHRERLPERLLRQAREPMAMLLIAAAAVSGFGLGERADAIAILTIVVLNATIGLIQEGKAARALEALREMESPSARIRRGGVDAVVPSREIAPGDLVLLAAGDRVPADLRLCVSSSLEMDESLLTGESLPVQKDARAIDAIDAGMADRRSLVYSGTLVARGSAGGIAIATGGKTEIGAIAEQISKREPPTPLQAELASLTKTLGAISIMVAAGVFALTLARMGVSKETFQESFLAAVALAVAAVPEGLATVVTVGLALGVRRMSARGAIIRRMPAVETLGCTTVIATDKTGTITENRLHLDAVVIAGGSGSRFEELPSSTAADVAEILALCNDATLDPPAGDPLEVALLEAVGSDRVAAIRETFPRLDAIPFDSDRMRMTTLHGGRGERGRLLVKGAPEALLPSCSDLMTATGETVPLSAASVEQLRSRVEELASGGMRVLALARRENASIDEESDMTLIAFASLGDAIRPGAASAVGEAAAAGISLVMVTGDHVGTASSVARNVGIADEGHLALTGAELTDGGFPEDPASVPVYARVDPQQKLALVEALQSKGHVVAVTGDGVNDAPALRRAEIGVAMGLAGSDVAREASDMVVTDDDLATIVAAVKEGRGIYENIRKVVDYLIAGNFSEIVVVVASLVLFPALGVPLLPLQLLWINLLTDGMPALALGVDPTDPTVMTKPPRLRSKQMLTRTHLFDLFVRGLLIATFSVGSLAYAHFVWNEPWPHARATMFTVLVVAHLLWAFAARRPRDFRGLFANPWLILAVLGGIAAQIVILTVPAARSLFGTAPLTLHEWVLVATCATLPAVIALLLPWRSGSI